MNFLIVRSKCNCIQLARRNLSCRSFRWTFWELWWNTKNEDIILQESSIQIVNFRTIENNPALCDNYGAGFTTDVLFSISENLNRNLGSNSFEITLLSESGTVIPAPAAWDLDSDGILDPKPQGFVYRYPNLQA